jgi:hypothetical protein
MYTLPPFGAVFNARSRSFSRERRPWAGDAAREDAADEDDAAPEEAAAFRCAHVEVPPAFEAAAGAEGKRYAVYIAMNC